MPYIPAGEAVKTTEPPPASSRAPRPYLAARKAPVRLKSRALCQQPLDRGTADPARRAGDERALALKPGSGRSTVVASRAHRQANSRTWGAPAADRLSRHDLALGRGNGADAGDVAYRSAGGG